MGGPTKPSPDAKSPAAPAICHPDPAIGGQNAKTQRPAAIWHPAEVAGTGDRAIARIAGAQHGVVARAQLRAAGIGAGAIAHRLKRGRLHRTSFRGVYVLGHTALAPLARQAAAIVAFEGFAAISHRSAAAIWGIASDGSQLDVTAFRGHRACRCNLNVHRVAQLDPRDWRTRSGIPVTAPARTVLDFVAHATPAEREKALAEARVQRLVTDSELVAAIERTPFRAGVAALRALLRNGPELTRSEAERRLMDLIRSAKLPEPETNRLLCGYEVDFLWRAERLVVEVDGHAFHLHRGAFERDRRRDQVLVAAGYRVIRVTWRQLVEEPLAVIARLAQSIAQDP